MQRLTIRAMARAELDLGLDWAAQEGWNPGLHDGDSFWAADPGGFLIGLVDGEPVGMISAVRYGTTYGFIGLYIVRPAFRGQGYGIALWKAAMQALQGRLVGLDGVVVQQENYRKSGFVLAHNNVRYQGTATAQVARANDDAIVSLASIPLSALVRYDAALFPYDRSSFLEHWVGQTQGTALGVVEGGELVGYGVMRPCKLGCKIGPLCADRPDVALRLFQGLAARVPEGTVLQFDVPVVNPLALALALQQGMQPVFQTARMYTGNPPPMAMDRIYGITSFELG